MARTAVVVLFCLFLSHPALAQQTSSIAGVVRDASGGVLPGVTVEAASPALIEKVRAATTDGEGRYNIVDLRPGTYAVTFALPGFNTFRRDGITLTGGFTATVNADLQVGTLEQTITVTGEAPLVDTQNVRQQTVLSNEMLEALPTSMKGQNTVITLTLGLTGVADVSGNYTTQVGGTFHGKAGTKVQVDGMSIQNLQGNGNTGYQINAGTIEEMTVQTSGISAESNADGIVINMIPREGGNLFSGTVSGLYTNDRLGSDNLTDELRSRGLTTVSKILKIYDAQVTVGGPIKRDRLWFFTSQREWGSRNQDAGTFWNKTQGTPFYTPDLLAPLIAIPVVRIARRAADVAGVAAQQGQRVRRLPGRVHLSIVDGRRPRPGSDPGVSLPAAGAVPGDLELTGDEPAAARGGLRGRAVVVAAVPRPGRRHEPHFDPGAVDEHPLQRDADLRLRRSYEALLAAVLGVVRDRLARVQGRHPDRGRRPDGA